MTQGFKTLGMTSEGLWEIFEGDFADVCAEQFLLMLIGGRAKGQACTDGDPHWHERKLYMDECRAVFRTRAPVHLSHGYAEKGSFGSKL